MSWFTHHVETVITTHDVGTYRYTVVYCDASVAATLDFPRGGRLRIEADIAGVPVRGAWQPAGGRWYLMLSKAALAASGLRVGDVVEVSFRVLAASTVDEPPALQALLDGDRAAAAGWRALSAGRQRGLAHLVSSAQRASTRAARLAEITRVLRGEAPEPWVRATRPSRPQR